MAIEESVMRDAKSSGGFSHGTLRDLDASLETWFLFTECTSKISGKVKSLVESISSSKTPPSTFGHADTKPAARKRDKQIVHDISEFVKDTCPFDPTRDLSELLSLSTGLTDRNGKCNPETAKEYGELFLPKLDNKPYLMTVSRSQKVTNLCALKPSIKTGRQDQCGQMALFNRLILIAARESCVEKCLDFELTCYPLSIFNIYGFMRASNKSAFGALFNDNSTAKSCIHT